VSSAILLLSADAEMSCPTLRDNQERHQTAEVTMQMGKKQILLTFGRAIKASNRKESNGCVHGSRLSSISSAR